MIKGIGCDIVDLSRLDVNNHALVTKLLTTLEMDIFLSKKTVKQKREFLGGRFAGKEAFFKAIGIKEGLNSFGDIEILNDLNGKPFLNYSNAFISIAHEKDYVIAYVIIEV